MRIYWFALGFLPAAAYWPPIYGAGTVPRVAALSVLIPLGLWFVRIHANILHGALLAFVGWAAITGLWSPITEHYLGALWWLLLMLGAFCIGAECENPDAVYAGVGWGLIPSALACLWQMFGTWPFDQVAGPSGTFVNKNFLAEIAVLSAVTLALSRKWALLVPAAFCLIVTQSKGAWLAALVCLLVWLWKRSRVAAIGVGVIALCLGALKVPNLLSIWVRLDVWADTLEGLVWAGNGLGSFWSEFPSHSPRLSAQFARVEFAHNEFLHFAYELGPGALLLVAVFGLALLRGQERERLVLLAALVCAMFSFPLHLPASGFMAFFVAGVLSRDWRDVGIAESLRGIGVRCWAFRNAVTVCIPKSRPSGGPIPLGLPSPRGSRAIRVGKLDEAASS